MNIINISTPDAYSWNDEYSNLERIQHTFTITYEVDEGSGVYNYTITDGDTSNPETTITTNNAPFFDITFDGLKADRPTGISTFNGTIVFDVEDVSTGDVEEHQIDYELTFDNQGVLLSFAPLKVSHANVNKAIGYDRDVAVETLTSQGTMKLLIAGGSGELSITWDPDGFIHPALTLVDPTQLSGSEIDVIMSSQTADIPQEYLESAGGNWVQSGEIEYTVQDLQSLELISGKLYWSFTIAVVSEVDPRAEFRYESRTVSSRFRIRDVNGISWYDMCYDEMYGYNISDRAWQRLIPSKTFVRDANNIDWLEVNCDFDPEFDDPCQALGDDDCNGEPNDPFAGSGNGKGSNGPVFDPVLGYPNGYDMPDCFLGGFAVSTLPISQGSAQQATGFMVQRPGLLIQETYDPIGLTPDDEHRGDWNSPNIIGASTWSRGSAVTETIYELTDQDGFYELLYAAYDSVSIDVYHHGVRVATTCGQVPEKSRGVLTFGVKLGLVSDDRRIFIRVRGSNHCEWAYQVVGTKDTNDHYEFDPHSSSDYAEIGQNLYEEPDFVKEEYLGTPVFPAPCRATVGNTNLDKSYPFRLSDRVASKNFFEYYHYASDTSGLMVLDYSSWNNADKIEVYHKGIRIASNYDFKNTDGSITFEWHAEETDIHELVVRVYTETLDIAEQLSSWYYSLYCVDIDPSGDPWHVPVGPRQFPWDCDAGDDGTPTQNPTTRNVIYSQGHPVMEDHINIDNGVPKGAFRIQFNSGEASESESLVTVFNQDGSVIKCYDPLTGNFENTIAVLGQNVNLDYFNFDQDDESNVYKKIYVRIESALGDNWTYTVGCPVPLIDITLDPVDISADITIDDTSVLAGDGAGQVMARLSKPMQIEVSVDYYMEDGSAKDQTDYCSSTGTITFPVGVIEVPIPFGLAPCGALPDPDPVPDPSTYYFKPILSAPYVSGGSLTHGLMMENSLTKGMMWSGYGLADDNDDFAEEECNATKVFLECLKATADNPSNILLVSDTDEWYTFDSKSNDGKFHGRAFNHYLDRIWPASTRTVATAQSLIAAGNDNAAYFQQFDFIITMSGGFVFPESYSSKPPASYYETLYDTILAGIPFLYYWPSTGGYRDDPDRDFRGALPFEQKVGIEPNVAYAPTLSVAVNVAEFGDHPVWDGLSGVMLKDGINGHSGPQMWWTRENKDLITLPGRDGLWLKTTV